MRTIHEKIASMLILLNIGIAGKVKLSVKSTATNYAPSVQPPLYKVRLHRRGSCAWHHS